VDREVTVGDEVEHVDEAGQQESIGLADDAGQPDVEWRPNAPGRVRRPIPTNWSSGEYRAPSPLDDIPQPSPLFSGDAWYSEAFLTRGQVALPPVGSSPALPAPAAGQDDVDVDAMIASATDTIVQRPVWPEPDPERGGGALPVRPVPPVHAVPPAPVIPPAPATRAVIPPAPDPWDRPLPEGWPSHPETMPAPPAPQFPPGQFPSGQFPPEQFPPGQFPQGEEAWSDPDGARRKQPLLAVGAVAVAFAVLAGALAWIFLPGRGDVTATSSNEVTTTSSPTAAPLSGSQGPGLGTGDPAATPSQAADATQDSSAQAEKSQDSQEEAAVTALNGLLDRSTEARGQVGATAGSLQSCGVEAAKAAKIFREAGAEREKLSSQASAMRASVGTGTLGDALRAFAAFQDVSVLADESLATWADDISGRRCSGHAPRTDDQKAADRYSGQASAAKERFVKIWNPIAEKYGLDTRTAGEI
jgi:hypothetical protein